MSCGQSPTRLQHSVRCLSEFKCTATGRSRFEKRATGPEPATDSNYQQPMSGRYE